MGPYRKCKKPILPPSESKHHNMTAQTVRQSWKCNFCDKEFATEGNKNSHLKAVHLQEKCFPCTFTNCTSKFSQRNDLELHKQTHLPREERTRFPCSECDKVYLFAKSVLLHKRAAHEGVRYTCTEPHCGKMFLSKDSLKFHSAAHSDDQPFKCPNCLARYKCRRNLNRHIAQKHKGKETEAHYCNEPNCKSTQRAFPSRRRLQAHKINMHQKEKTLPCLFCHKLFKRDSHRKIHVRRHIGEKWYECKRCDKAFVTGTGLKNHMIQHKNGCQGAGCNKA